MCRDFGVSRKTGCEIFDCYEEPGQAVRGERSRRPVLATWCLPVCPGRTVDLLAETEEVKLKKSPLILHDKSPLIVTSHFLPPI